MTVSAETLTGLAKTLRITLDHSGTLLPGQAVTAGLAPPLSELRVPSVNHFPAVIKQVIWDGHELITSFTQEDLNQEILQGVPLPNLTEGTLGRFVQVPIVTELPVELEIEWSIRDQENQELIEGEDFIVLGGTLGGTFQPPPPSFPQFQSGSPEITVAFAPRVVEQTDTMRHRPILKNFIQARVRLSASDSTSDWVELPKVPVLVAPLLLPTVLALFRHADFAQRSGRQKGWALILVPHDSPVRNFPELQEALTTLELALDELSLFPTFNLLLNGIQTMGSALKAQQTVRVHPGSARKLKRIKMPGLGTANNRTSSAIFLGIEGSKVACFIPPNCNKQGFWAEGRFDLTIGPAMHTLVRNFNAEYPNSEPHGNEIDVVQPPKKAPKWPGGGKNFNDALSSVCFVSK